MTTNNEPQVAQVDIGQLLIDQRRASGASAKEAALSTKLSTSVIESMEANQFSDIGTAVYVRGYLGIYAKYLGLDAARVIDLYNTQYPAEEIAIRPSVAQISSTNQQTRRHSKTLSLLTALCVIGGLAYGYSQLEGVLIGKPSPAVVAEPVVETDEASSVDSSVGTVLDEVNSAQTLADDVLSGVTLGSNDGLVTDLTLPDLADNADEGEVESTGGINLTSTADLGERNSAAEKQDSVSANETAEAASESEAETLVGKTIAIKMTFKEDCWLKVLDAEGKTLTSKIYTPKRALKVTGKAPLTVMLGRPYSVKSFSINEQSATLADYKVANIKYEIK